MGIIKNGPNGEVRGRIGNLVYYVLNGQNVVRKVGKTNKEPTLLQLSSRLETRISGKFLKKLAPFFDVGFSIEILGTKMNTFNMAVEINKHKMFKGEYPNFEIDFPQLELSRGILKPGENLQVTANNDAITFSWMADPIMQWPESTDQVMMLAYFPLQNRTVCKIGGNTRTTGSDQLVLPPTLVGQFAETFFAFVSADRKQVSDSTYTGSINSQNH